MLASLVDLPLPPAARSPACPTSGCRRSRRGRTAPPGRCLPGSA